MKKTWCIGLAAPFAFGACAALAADVPLRLEDCAVIRNNGARLACFDRLAANNLGLRRAAPALQEQLPAAETAPLFLETPPYGLKAKTSRLAEHWEIGPQNKRGIFNFRPHHDNYIIAAYNPSPNEEPYRPLRTFSPQSDDLSDVELAFQIGFKLKFAERVMGTPVDLWFGYTQRSFWQAANEIASSPFRETNYQPEVMAVVPLNLELLGVRARFANVGFVHESNGQASILSRSWNRVYAQVGLESGDLTFLARIWNRIDEDREDDDNPDIEDYMGHGDLVGTYRWKGHEFSLLTRYNFDTHNGAVQLGWAFPLSLNLKGYVQLFSGYGQSLIDYNYKQQALGVGVLVSY